MFNITISSLNVQGLGNNEKRREIFQWLRKKKFSIYMLQEVLCTEKSFETWVVIRLFSAALQVIKQVSLSCLITTLPSRF